MILSFFSIVIPMYNKAPHIRRTIESVRAQLETEWECIIVDDSSTDGSYEVAGKETRDDNRFRLIRRASPGPGGYAARNEGTRLARAKWIALLDADDEWMEDHLSKIRGAIARYPDYHFFCSSAYEILPDGSRILDRYRTKSSTHDIQLIDLLAYTKAGYEDRNPISTSACVFDRAFLIKIGGFPEGEFKRGGDRDTWLRAISESPLVWTPYATAVYHRDSVNMVTNTIPPDLDQCLDQTLITLLNNQALMNNRPELRNALKRLWNYERKGAIRRRIHNRTLKTNDVRMLYISVEPIYAFYVFLAAFLPFCLVGRLKSIFKQLNWKKFD